MIETSNPEIDVEELMHRVRAEAAKLKHVDLSSSNRRALSLVHLPPVRMLAPPPRTFPFKSVDVKQERLDRLLDEARRKSEGDPRIPKMFRRFFGSRAATTACCSRVWRSSLARRCS